MRVVKSKILGLVIALACLTLGGTSAPQPSGSLVEAEQAHRRFDYPAAIAIYDKVQGLSAIERSNMAEVVFWYAATLEGDAQAAWLERVIRDLEQQIKESPAQPKAVVDRVVLSRLHAQLGRALGQLALHRGGKSKIELGQRIRAEADLALSLDSEDAQAHAVLGKWHFELASLSGIERTFGGLLFGKIPEGSFETAVAELEKAVELDAGMPYYRLMLAQALLKTKSVSGAHKQLETLTHLLPREAKDLTYIAQARKMLADGT